MNMEEVNLLCQFGLILHSRPEHVVLQVMMLPDTHYNLIFAQVSLQLNTDLNTLKKLFIKVATRQLFVKFSMQSKFIKQSLTTQIHGEIDNNKGRQTYQHAVKQEFKQFQQLFTEKLIQVLRYYNTKAEFSDNNDVCIKVNLHIAIYGQKQFWKHLQTHIPQKTAKQLREYYQKSFQRILYENHISAQDKQILCEMIKSQQNATPTDIANQFLNICNNQNYFKRSIVMYVINQKRR
ncbi:SANT/Myb_domain [Hexamita inflata]|uniref:SANT/Myb_domain n=1 Tax=Hexamita inflata TaxID=28002 RepID=A0ABP1HII0_9EUKA